MVRVGFNEFQDNNAPEDFIIEEQKIGWLLVS